MPIGMFCIYRLLLVCVCVCVCTVTNLSSQDKASGVRFWRVVQGRPGQGICRAFPEAQNRTNRRAAASVADLYARPFYWRSWHNFDWLRMSIAELLVVTDVTLSWESTLFKIKYCSETIIISACASPCNRCMSKWSLRVLIDSRSPRVASWS